MKTSFIPTLQRDPSDDYWSGDVGGGTDTPVAASNQHNAYDWAGLLLGSGGLGGLIGAVKGNQAPIVDSAGTTVPPTIYSSAAQNSATSAAPVKKSNTGLIIGIIAGVVVLVIILIILFKK